MITDGVHTENTEGNGGPQADFVGECESSEFKRNLNGCPQADSFGERQLENNKNPQMTEMEVRRRTVLRNANYGELTVN